MGKLRPKENDWSRLFSYINIRAGTEFRFTLALKHLFFFSFKLKYYLYSIKLLHCKFTV